LQYAAADFMRFEVAERIGSSDRATIVSAVDTLENEKVGSEIRVG
jgi:hypothetical protein